MVIPGGTKGMAVKKRETTDKKARTTGDLSPEDWTRAVLMAWGEGGYRAVAIEPLARRLGVTKGSFYWHFESRAALIEAALAFWEREGTEAVIWRLEQLDNPRTRLATLFEEAWDRLDYLRTEAAIGATALTGEPIVAPIYERVQKRRLDYVTGLFQKLGFPRAEARRRAIAVYSAFLGSAHIVILGEASLSSDASLKRQVRLLIDLHVPAH